MACATALATRAPAAEERKTVTTLFCDLVGFTAMTEAADPEDVDRLLREYFARATRVIEEHGGVVEKFIGDAVVGVFGVPVVHEDDAARAVRAGLGLLAAIDGLTRPDGRPLQARVGVNTGLAVVRLDVAPGSGEGFLTGDAVNTAARLQAAAPPMRLAVGELTHRLAGQAFLFEALAPLSLKGKAGLVKAWLVTSPATSGAPDRTSSRAVRMIGREAELEVCADAVARLRQGRGGLLLITGEAGIGKTRLVEEVHGVAADEGCAWLEGHALSFGRTISYWPFLEIVQQDAGIASDDDERTRASKLAARVDSLFGEESAEVLPYLATLLSLPLPETLAQKVRNMDGEAMGGQVYRASRRYFSRLAEARPHVVVLEDVHWLDASSAALLEHLLPLVRDVPILFCCVSRPEPDSPLTLLQELARVDYADCARQVPLDMLSEAESSALVRAVAEMEELPTGLRDAILGKAQGNPFFLEEIVRSLIDLGGLERDAATGAYRVNSRMEQIAIPDTLVGVIMARVDRLDDDLKQVLRLASVIGRTFFYRLLTAIGEAERDLDRSLALLASRELVLEKAREPELEYMFKHALVQEATYESILMQRRRDLHRRVAGAIETLFPERLEESCGLLAYHYSRAEDWPKALEYLVKAGDQAGSIAADAEALDHYERAMEAYGRAFGDSWDPLEKAALERKMGEALYRRGEQGQAREYLLRALATLGSPFPDASGALWRAIAAQLVRQVWHRLPGWSGRRSKRDETVRIDEERCRVYLALVWTIMMADMRATLLALMLLLNVGESAKLAWAESAGASAVAVTAQAMPSRWLYRFYIRRGRTLAEAGGLDPQKAQAAWFTGMWDYWIEGDFDAALQSLGQAADLYRTLGETRGWATAMGVATYVPAERGELAKALVTAREGILLGVETGDRLTEVWWQAWEGELLFLAGEMVAGEEGMRRSVDAMLAMMDLRIGAKVAGRLAACYLAQGRLGEAQTLLAEYREHLRSYGIAGGNASFVILGSAAAGLAEAERADDAARGAKLRDARRACRAALKQVRVDRTAAVPACRARGTYEWLRGRPGRAEKWWQRSLAHAERLGCRYEGALTTLEIGRRSGDRVHLERAEAEFAAMGAKFWLAQTRELLQ